MPGFTGMDCSELDAPTPKHLVWEKRVEERFMPSEWRVFYFDINPTTAIAWLNIQVRIHTRESYRLQELYKTCFR